MNESTAQPGRPSRRVVARGAAWSVPVVAVGAAAPAMAASGGTGGITASCVSAGGTGATYSVSVTGSLSPQLQVVFTHTGSGSFSISTPAGWVLADATASTRTYLIPVAGGTVNSTGTVNFTGIAGNSSATVTAVLSATSGQEITGDTSAAVTITRQGGGSSSNYSCSVIG